MEEFLLALARQILIPEIAIVFRAHANANLPPPTSEQVEAALGLDADKVVSIGRAWLAAHPAPAITGGAATPAPGAP